VTLERIPPVRDIRTMEKLLAYTGASVTHKNRVVTIQAARSRMRGLLMNRKDDAARRAWCWAAARRCGRARVFRYRALRHPNAGPINLHVPGLETAGRDGADGARLHRSEAPKGLRGAGYRFRSHFVTGTRPADGRRARARETVINNAASEPEVVDVGRAADQDGRAHRRRRNFDDTRARRR